MIIPSIFFGRYGEVRSRTQKLTERLLSGKSFAEALPDRRVVDTSTMTSGYFTLMTHNDLSTVEAHFHFTLLRAALTQAEGVPDGPAAEALFAELLEREWGPLVFADPKDLWIASSLLTDNTPRRKAYLRSVLRHERSLDREGGRYIAYNGRLGTFWQANGALRQALREEGLSPTVLEKGLTAEAFRKFMREAGL